LSPDRPAGPEEASEDRARVDGLAREVAQRRDDQRLERGRDLSVRPQAEPVPRQTQYARGDGAARDPVEPGEVAQLIQAPEGADVKQHRAVPAARKAERDSVLEFRLLVTRLDAHR
jgi:hypothetical protein